jgi:hypothetical protein
MAAPKLDQLLLHLLEERRIVRSMSLHDIGERGNGPLEALFRDRLAPTSLPFFQLRVLPTK